VPTKGSNPEQQRDETVSPASILLRKLNRALLNVSARFRGRYILIAGKINVFQAGGCTGVSSGMATISVAQKSSTSDSNTSASFDFQNVFCSNSDGWDAYKDQPASKAKAYSKDACCKGSLASKLTGDLFAAVAPKPICEGFARCLVDMMNE